MNKYYRYLMWLAIVLVVFSFCFRLVTGIYSIMMFGDVFVVLWFSFRLWETRKVKTETESDK